MAINLDRFNSSSHSNSNQNRNANSNKPAIERMLTNLFERHALDDTSPFPSQDSIPLADWETLDDIGTSSSSYADGSVVVEVVHPIESTDTEEDKPSMTDGDHQAGSKTASYDLGAKLTTDTADVDETILRTPKVELMAEEDGEDDPQDEGNMALEDAVPINAAAPEAEESTSKATEAEEDEVATPDLESDFVSPSDDDQMTPEPLAADKATTDVLTPTLVRLPVPPKRGSVPKFLVDLEAKRDADDTAMRPLPYYNFNWMNEDANAQIDYFDDLDEGYEEDYDDNTDDRLDAYDEYGYFEDDYDDIEDERRPRRKALIALVAAVAIVSFIAGGAVARLSSQVPVLFGEKPATNETQATYSERHKEQATPDETPAPETLSPVQTEPQSDNAQTPSDEQNPIETNEDAPNPPSYDTGDDTTDDWYNTENQQDNELLQDSPSQDTSENTWQWNLDQDGTNSITYNQDGNELTFNYDGYELTVPIGELIGNEDHYFSFPYGNDTSYENNGDVDHRDYGYGTGYDTEEDRDRDQWRYRPQSYIWS